MGVVVLQPSISVWVLGRVRTEFLHCAGCLDSMGGPIGQDLLLVLVLVW